MKEPGDEEDSSTLATFWRQEMHKLPFLKRASCMAALLALGGISAAAQQAAPSAQEGSDLQKQLELLKQQYESTTHDLQERIAALEQQIQKQQEKQKEEKGALEKTKEGTISAAELAAQEAAKKAVEGNSDQVGAKFQGQVAQEPRYEFLRDADQKISKLEEQVNSFEFHGYVRSGYGLNSAGGQQVAISNVKAEVNIKVMTEHNPRDEQLRERRSGPTIRAEQLRENIRKPTELIRRP
jgi:hypothetical protein